MLYDQLNFNQRCAADEYFRQFAIDLQSYTLCKYTCKSLVPNKVDFNFVFVNIGGTYFVADNVYDLLSNMDVLDNQIVRTAVQSGYSAVTLTLWK